MRQLIIIAAAVIMTVTGAVAQPRGGMMKERAGMAKERIHAAKMAYITDRLHLTSAQASSFIPVYNECEDEVLAVRKKYRQRYMATHKDTQDDDIKPRQYIDDDLNYQQEVLDIKKKYKDRFLKVLSEKQLTELYESEREFRKLLQQRLKEKRMGMMQERKKQRY